LPNHAQARRNRLTELKKLEYTIVLYESCHRIVSTLEDIHTVYGETQLFVARELTKKFEEALHGNAHDILARLTQQKIRGEFVVVI